MNLGVVDSILAKTARSAEDDSEPILDAEQIEEANSVDEIIDLYDAQGVEFDSIKDAYHRVKDDYWHNSADLSETNLEGFNFGQTEVDGGTVYVTGINHGREMFPLSPSVESALEDEIEALLSGFDDDQALLFEDEVDAQLFDSKYKQRSNVRISNDLEKVKEQLQDSKLKKTVSKLEASVEGYLHRPILEVINYRNTLLAEEYDSRKFEKSKLLRKSARDPNWIGAAQVMSQSDILPLDLEKEFKEQIADQHYQKAEEAGERLACAKSKIKRKPYRFDEWAAFASAAADRLSNAFAEQLYRSNSAIREDRSELIAEEALEALEDNQEAYLIVGSNHAPQIIDYLAEH